MVTNVTISSHAPTTSNVTGLGKSLSHKPDAVHMHTKTGTQCCRAGRLINRNCKQVMIHIHYASNRMTASSDVLQHLTARHR